MYSLPFSARVGQKNLAVKMWFFKRLLFVGSSGKMLPEF